MDRVRGSLLAGFAFAALSPVIAGLDVSGWPVLLRNYVLPGAVAPNGHYHLTWLRQVGTSRDRLTASVQNRTAVSSQGERVLHLVAETRPHGWVQFIQDRWIVKRIGLG